MKPAPLETKFEVRWEIAKRPMTVFVSRLFNNKTKIHLYTWENPTQECKAMVSTNLQSKTRLPIHEVHRWVEELITQSNSQ